MLATLIPNHVEQALSQLLTQYKGQPRITALFTALVQQVQDAEDAAYGTNEARQLFNGTTYPAVGAQLDGIGALVGIARNGLSDADYLVFILGKIAEDFSDDTVPTVARIVDILFRPELLMLLQLFPAEVDVVVGAPELEPNLFNAAIRIVQNSIGAGVLLGFVEQCDPTNAFRFSALTGLPASLLFSSVPTTGTWELLVGGVSAGALAFNADATAIQAAINALNGLTLVTVTGDYAGGFFVDWGGGAIAPLSIGTSTIDATVIVSDSVVIAPGTGGGFGDTGDPDIGGLFGQLVPPVVTTSPARAYPFNGLGTDGDIARWYCVAEGPWGNSLDFVFVQDGSIGSETIELVDGLHLTVHCGATITVNDLNAALTANTLLNESVRFDSDYFNANCVDCSGALPYTTPVSAVPFEGGA